MTKGARAITPMAKSFKAYVVPNFLLVSKRIVEVWLIDNITFYLVFICFVYY